jgi:hypothetical protein
MHPVARTIKVDQITVVRNNFTRYFITLSVQSGHVSAIYWPSSGDFLTIANIKIEVAIFATDPLYIAKCVL